MYFVYVCTFTTKHRVCVKEHLNKHQIPRSSCVRVHRSATTHSTSFSSNTSTVFKLKILFIETTSCCNRRRIVEVGTRSKNKQSTINVPDTTIQLTRIPYFTASPRWRYNPSRVAPPRGFIAGYRGEKCRGLPVRQTTCTMIQIIVIDSEFLRLSKLYIVTRDEQGYLQSNKNTTFFITRIYLQKIEKIEKK